MAGTLKILMVGDVVGGPGRHALTRYITLQKQAGKLDFAVANCENAAGGRGLTKEVAEELFRGGLDVITLGDHVWDQKEVIPYLDAEPRVVRPANFAPGCAGRGITTVEHAGIRITVMAMLGRVFMPTHNDCPFRCADAILKNRASLGDLVLLDFHAEATAEKVVLGRYLDGRITAQVGTHTHVQTSDEAILPNGSGYITDLGMTGVKDSAIGRDLQSVIQKFLTGMPAKYMMAQGDATVEGVIIEADTRTGKTKSIRRVRELIQS